jgi:hypothetical protein|nr:MAG TPA: hypothetical protein [Caudoviricetes sp.]
MKKTQSLLDLNEGSIKERVNYEMQKVLENIQDPNTDEKPREINIKAKITPVAGRKTYNVNVEVSKKLRPTKTINFGVQQTKLDGAECLVEIIDETDGQIDMDGEVKERSYFEV